MALANFLGKKSNYTVPDAPSTATEGVYAAEPMDPTTSRPGYGGMEGYDPESNGGVGRPMNRIDGKGSGSDTDSSLSVDQQMELEKNNAIKYRTCSWQKVILHFIVA